MERFKPKTWQDHIDEWSQTYIQESFASELKKALLPETLARDAIKKGKEDLYHGMHPNLVEALDKPAEVASYKEDQDYGPERRVITLSKFWKNYVGFLGTEFFVILRESGIQDDPADSMTSEATDRIKREWVAKVDPNIQTAMENTKIFLPPLK